MLTAVLLLLPVVELALLIFVGTRLGVGETLLLLLAGAVAGAVVLRHVGSTAIRRLAEASTGSASTGSASTGSAAEPALLVLAGGLLILPGFASDLVGLALLVPPVRRTLARRTGEAVVRRFRVRAVRVVQGQVVRDDAGMPGERRTSPADVRVIQARPPDDPTQP